MAGKNGGARPGAGRRAGKPNKRNEKTIAQIDANKYQPLDIMLATMNELVDKALSLTDPDERIAMMERASEQASKIAPYKHARLSSITAKVVGVTHESVLEQLTAWEHERAAATASDASALH